MELFPAIDLYGKKAVRLLKGDYAQMTVYNDDPIAVARDFSSAGAKNLHTVDLEGAKSGETPNIEIVARLVKESGLDVEVGGGVRSEETVKKYLEIGVKRVILGTKAVTDEDFLVNMVQKYGDKIAVGADIKDGLVAIKGWTEKSDVKYLDFCKKIEQIGVETAIITDISKDGAMKGTNLRLYSEIVNGTRLKVIASGGVSTLGDIEALKEIGVYGAIVGKAYYVRAFDLKDALKIAESV